MDFWMQLCLLLFSFHLGRCNLIKIWSSDSNHHEKNRWFWSDSFCPKDRIIFPQESVIFLDKIVQNQQIVLPRNGEIIFGDHVEIGRVPEKDCSGVDRKFYMIHGDWVDPNNWNQSFEGHIVRGNDGNNPIPHVDRIPCTKDRVVFPKGMTFKAYLKLISDSKIDSIEINGIPLSDHEFQTFIRSRTGRYMFPSSFYHQITVGPSELSCDTGQGCSCDHRTPYFIESVCSMVQSCPKVTCINPIRPTGHCCPLCGAMVKLAIPDSGDGGNGDFARFLRHFKDLWTEKYAGTLGYASRISPDGPIEAILTDNSNQPELPVQAARQLLEDLNDAENRLGIKVQSVEMIVSTISDETSTLLGIWWLLVILIVLIVLVGLAYKHQAGLSLSFSRNRPQLINSQFTFVRFSGGIAEESERLAMELESTTLGGNGAHGQSSGLIQSSSSHRLSHKSDSGLFAISEEKLSFRELSKTESQAQLDRSENLSGELEAEMESYRINDKQLLLDTVSLDR